MLFRGVPLWRSSQVLSTLVVGVVLLLHAGTDLFGALERHFYDFASTATSRQPSNQIALIAIDDRSIASLGPWPWPRDIHARLIDILAAAKPKVVVDAVPLFDTQPNQGLAYIQKMKAALALQPSASTVAQEGDQNRSALRRLADLLDEAEQALDGDTRLASSLQQAGNVLLMASHVSGKGAGMPNVTVPPFTLKSLLEKPAGLELPAVRLQVPLRRFGEAVVGVGHFAPGPDVDGVLRSEPLLVAAGGKALPSLALLATTAYSLNRRSADIHMASGPALQLGGLTLTTDTSGMVLPRFYQATGNAPAFVADSFSDVLTGQVAATKYANKLVLIGLTATGLDEPIAVPGNPSLSSLETLAHISSGLLMGHVAAQPPWSIWVVLTTTVLMGAYLVFGLPLLSVGVASVLTLALLLSLLAVEFWGLASLGFWLKLVLPAALLVLGFAAQMTLRYLLAGRVELGPVEESAGTDRMMGLALQGQGQLDMAFERFRRAPMNAALAEDLYWLALDFERKQHFDKVQTVYEHILVFDPDYKDVKSRLTRAKHLAAPTESLTPSSVEPADGGEQKLVLGRYQVEKELGKGAMGVVYLGKDPKIGRRVALKTMALSQTFDVRDLADARERFFREAKAAGHLQHPNIVTIFDVGDERDLAYIAMEYVKGHDLQLCCKRGQLMPVPRLLSIVARVARALAYAHGLQVIHRDIKPGNVMYDIVTDTVKVTDFGIARIADANKTRTGLILGSPSYMSPEQLAGLPLDGRSDLYSLGVMMFQLLTGALPFRADSMAELMLKIATETAPDIRHLRPALPDALANIVARLLSKSPEDRYQDGNALAKDVSLCVLRPPAGAIAPHDDLLSSTKAEQAEPPDLESKALS